MYLDLDDAWIFNLQDCYAIDEYMSILLSALVLVRHAAMPAWANAERGEGAHMTAQKVEKSDRPLTNKP